MEYTKTSSLSSMQENRPTTGTPERIILFTRFPEPGQTKTRLIPALGPDGAAALQQRLTEEIATRITALCWRRGTTAEIRYTGGDQARMQEWLGPRFPFLDQGSGDLGQRMARAAAAAFASGMKQVLLLGADCPGISTTIMSEALDRLRDTDLVIGPARDGGYYAIGMNRPCPGLFNDMPWGTDRLLAQTLDRAGGLRLSVHLLAPLQDIDRPEDLVRLNLECTR